MEMETVVEWRGPLVCDINKRRITAEESWNYSKR